MTISKFDDLPRIDVTDFPQGDNIVNDKDFHQTNTANSLLRGIYKPNDMRGFVTRKMWFDIIEIIHCKF